MSDQNGSGGYVVKVANHGGIRPERVAVGSVFTGRTQAVVEKWTFARFNPDGSVKRCGKGAPTRFDSQEQAEDALREAIELRTAYEITGIGPGHAERTFTRPSKWSSDGRGNRTPTAWKEVTLPWSGLPAGTLRLAEVAPWSEVERMPDAPRMAERVKHETTIARQRVKLDQLQAEIAAAEAALAAKQDTPATDRQPTDWTGTDEKGIQTRTRSDGSTVFRARGGGRVSPTVEDIDQARRWLDQQQQDEDPETRRTASFGVGRPV
jgi:hypothetical protein